LLGDKIAFAETQYDCLENADALIVATEWNEFRTPDFDRIIASLKDAVVFDGRNVFDVEQMEKKGFHYESIGRPLVNQPKLV
jgi:UDPglucose 6-dehydrogenase